MNPLCKQFLLLPLAIVSPNRPLRLLKQPICEWDIYYYQRRYRTPALAKPSPSSRYTQLNWTDQPSALEYSSASRRRRPNFSLPEYAKDTYQVVCCCCCSNVIIVWHYLQTVWSGGIVSELLWTWSGMYFLWLCKTTTTTRADNTQCIKVLVLCPELSTSSSSSFRFDHASRQLDRVLFAAGIITITYLRWQMNHNSILIDDWWL